jgi:hypothetical protein
MFAKDGRHLTHVMSAHLVLPDTEILAQFVLLEEVDPLQLVIPLLVCQPLLSSQELCLLIVIECETLTADGHVFLWVALGVGDDLVIVGV